MVDVPTHLNSEQKELLKKFDEISGNTLHEFDDAKPGGTEKKRKKKFF